MQFPNIFSAVRNVFKGNDSQNNLLTNSIYATEALKAKVIDSGMQKYTNKYGVEHPFDYAIVDKLYAEEGLVSSIVDKYIDFIVGPGHYIKIDEQEKLSEKARAIIEQWEEDVDFDILLRDWIKQALLKGPSYMELGGKGIEKAKIINSNNMFVERDDKGEITGYNQVLSKVIKDNVTPFKLNEIAYLSFNRVGDNPYGVGIIYPLSNSLANYLKNKKELTTLLERKANSPIVATLGDREKGVIPTEAAIQAFGKKLEWLHNKHEWAVGPYVKMEALDFGNLGDKFNSILELERIDILASAQIPEVIMGKGSVPEGLAKVQLRTFQMRVSAFQDEIERVLEKQIYKRVLEANGISARVEIEWGMPDDEETNNRLTRIKELMAVPMASSTFTDMLEEESVKLLELDIDEYTKRKEEKKEEQEEMMAQAQAEADAQSKAPPAPKKESEFDQKPLPKVPGQERLQHCDCKVSEKLNAEYTEFPVKGEITEDKDYELHEWLGFNYSDLKDDIKKAISEEDFKFLKATTKWDKQRGKLSQTQIARLRVVLTDAFDSGRSINWIAREIKEKVKPGNLLDIDNEGQVYEALPEKIRTRIIARTESTRVANQGTLDNYENKKVEKVRWLAVNDENTSDICQENNGKVFTIDEAQGLIPAHINCRSTWIPVLED
jgi:SPP1 gp7 family putative phage head morphogenesis protein